MTWFCAAQMSMSMVMKVLITTFTMQWVALPPNPTQCHRETIREGFVWDIPYYDRSKDADPKGHTIDADYRFGVVRILPHV